MDSKTLSYLKEIKCSHCGAKDDYFLTKSGLDSCTDCMRSIWVGRKDGSPAFPGTDGNDDTWEGMSLRDYFAGQALIGLLNNSVTIEAIMFQTGTSFDNSEKILTGGAFNIADAMIRERDK